MPACGKLNQDRLNVSSALVGDDEVQTLNKITAAPCDLVDYYGDFESLLLTDYQGCVNKPGTSNKSLDLICPSTSDKFLLKLGYWTIEADDPNTDDTSIQVFEELAGSLRQLGIDSLRLLGCSTAVTTAGQGTITNLTTALGMKVYGTDRSISDADFDKNGFIDSEPSMLKHNPNLPPLPLKLLRMDAPKVRNLDLDDVDVLSLQDLTRWQNVTWPRRRLSNSLTPELKANIYALIDQNGRSMPGLWTVPSVEYWLPFDHSSRSTVLQVLFEWRMVRVYAKRLMFVPNMNNLFANSACYLVKDPEKLRELMTSLPSQRAQ